MLSKCSSAKRITPLVASLCILASMTLPGTASAGLLKPAGTPLAQFGFATGPEPDTKADFDEQFATSQRILGSGGLIRTGLIWNASTQNAPNFSVWNRNVLDTAESRNQIVLPSIRLQTYPSDAEWTNSLRAITRMYGPGGIYQKGGTYTNNGNTFSEVAHPGFAGMLDYELWNEPNMIGDLGGTMTPAKMTHLLKIGSAAMRDEAAKMGFKINIVGPAVGGIDLPYVKELWSADNNVFSYLNTLTVHAYQRQLPTQCSAGADNCITTMKLIRDFLDTHGGAHVHLGTTEGGFSGSNAVSEACLPPNVHTEADQSYYSQKSIEWLRANPSLDIDFYVTYHPVDNDSIKFTSTCGSYDPAFWKANLGLVSSTLALKPWGTNLKNLNAQWRTGTVTPPPSTSTTLISDLLNRTVTSGWGSAATGGAWTFLGSGSAKVNGAEGVLTGGAGTEPHVLSAASAANTSTVTTFKVSKKPLNGNAGVHVIARADNAGGALASKYYAGVDIQADGSSKLVIRREVAGTMGNAAAPQPIALNLSASTKYKLRVDVSGSAPTTIKVKVWLATATEPTSWMLTATDDAPELQDAGRSGLRFAIGAAVTNAPISALFDQVTVTNLG